MAYLRGSHLQPPQLLFDTRRLSHRKPRFVVSRRTSWVIARPSLVWSSAAVWLITTRLRLGESRIDRW
jgi:hypothetical protein